MKIAHYILSVYHNQWIISVMSLKKIVFHIKVIVRIFLMILSSPKHLDKYHSHIPLHFDPRDEIKCPKFPLLENFQDVFGKG